jgi:outer membrane protein assembly factor BamB
MKTNRLLLFFALALLALVLSACGGTPSAVTWPGLAADANAAYLTNGSVIYAVRLSDGEKLWTFSSSTKSVFYSNPAFTSDGQLLVGSAANDHALFRLDPKATDTARVTWTFTGAKDHWVATPLVVGDIVYAPNADGNLYVFDLSIPGEDKLTDTVPLGGKLWSQPVLAGNRLIVPSLDHSIHFLDVKTLEIQNAHTLGGAIPGSGAFDEKYFYIGSFDSAMVAMNISDAAPGWITPVQSWIWGAPLLVDGTLYFGDLGGNFYVMNAADGKIITSFQSDGGILASPILVDGNIVFVTESGTVYSLKPGETNPLSLEKLTAKLYTAPVAAGNLILVAPFQSEASLLIALDKDGKQVWSFFPQK